MPIFKNIGGNLVEYTTAQIMNNNQVGVGKPDGTTITVDADGTMHSQGGSGGGGATIIPKPVVNPMAIAGSEKVTIAWEDPADVMLDGIYISKWAGTKLVMKEGDYPTRNIAY